MKLIKRTYRIGDHHDKKVKKTSKKTKRSQSKVIRDLIENSDTI